MVTLTCKIKTNKIKKILEMDTSAEGRRRNGDFFTITFLKQRPTRRKLSQTKNHSNDVILGLCQFFVLIWVPERQ